MREDPYTIREKPAADPKNTNGITYDATLHKVTVHVWIDGDTMKSEVKYDGKVWDGKDDNALPAFTNTYQPKPADFKPVAQKVLKDDTDNQLTVKKGQFTFDLKDKAGKLLQSKTTEDGGKVTFDPISVNSDAMGGKAETTLHYTITERKGDDPYMEYDTTPRDVTATVKDDGMGNLTVTKVTYDGDTTGAIPTVTNTRHSRVMLPITGGMDPLMLAAITGTVLLLGGGMAVLLLKRRKATAHVGRHA